jgi:BCD family chlorophyll transporter-like MFS transporter
MNVQPLEPADPLGWLGIFRLGLVQTALGAIVVLTTSTINRVMVVELAMPAMLPGALVGLHYAVQLLRPRLGHGSDAGGRRTPWIVGGMATLALGGVTAAAATAWMSTQPVGGILLAILAFLAIGVGVGCAGTSLLVLLATRVTPRRRPAAATIVWVMMILGFILTSAIGGRFLDPFTPLRLVQVAGCVATLAFLVSLAAVYGIEAVPRSGAVPGDTVVAPSAGLNPAPVSGVNPASGVNPVSGVNPADVGKPSFGTALREVWDEPQARRFTLFVFMSMLAYSAQDLILEPFAGLVYGLTPGETTQLSGVQNSGVLLGMVLVACLGTAIGGPRLGSLRGWTIAGCLLSACALLALAFGGWVGPDWPLKPTVFSLGFANGMFAVAAIGSMMSQASDGTPSREGVRMGLWGASQAIAFGGGGFLGTVAVDLTRWLIGSPVTAYGIVFVAEAALFLLSVGFAPARIVHVAIEPN